MSLPDHFAVLGLTRRYRLDEAELEAHFHERSRNTHPDRHVKSDAASRVRAALETARLNEAHRALRDPMKRAEHLLALEGIALTDERGGHKVDPSFLAEVLELREALSEAAAAGDNARVRALEADVAARREAVLGQLDQAFDRYESGDALGLAAAADALVAERYFRRFLDEVLAHEEAELDRV